MVREYSYLDLVISSDPIDLSGIVYLPLFKYEAMLAIGKQHRLKDKTHVEPEDLIPETLITYPVDRNRLDVFTRFLDPADIEPQLVRTAELTAMMMQLVATGRGVASLPNWALTEYLQKDYIMAKSLGKDGQWGILYAAIREDQQDSPFMEDFLNTAIETSFATLSGIKPVA